MLYFPSSVFFWICQTCLRPPFFLYFGHRKPAISWWMIHGVCFIWQETYRKSFRLFGFIMFIAMSLFRFPYTKPWSGTHLISDIELYGLFVLNEWTYWSSASYKQALTSKLKLVCGTILLASKRYWWNYWYARAMLIVFLCCFFCCAWFYLRLDDHDFDFYYKNLCLFCKYVSICFVFLLRTIPVDAVWFCFFLLVNLGIIIN